MKKVNVVEVVRKQVAFAEQEYGRCIACGYVIWGDHDGGTYQDDNGNPVRAHHTGAARGGYIPAD